MPPKRHKAVNSPKAKNKPGKGPPKKEDIDLDKQATAVQHLFEDVNMHAERKYEQKMIAGDDDHALEHMEEVQ